MVKDVYHAHICVTFYNFFGNSLAIKKLKNCLRQIHYRNFYLNTPWVGYMLIPCNMGHFQEYYPIRPDYCWCRRSVGSYGGKPARLCAFPSGKPLSGAVALIQRLLRLPLSGLRW